MFNNVYHISVKAVNYCCTAYDFEKTLFMVSYYSEKIYLQKYEIELLFTIY